VSNWPTARTPLHYVTALSFSPGGGYLAIGNDRGRALLYRLNAYATA
jgi:U3 small nucleolar RNA-associated protein 18